MHPRQRWSVDPINEQSIKIISICYVLKAATRTQRIDPAVAALASVEIEQPHSLLHTPNTYTNTALLTTCHIFVNGPYAAAWVDAPINYDHV